MSAETPLIDIRPDHWEIVQRILQEHVPNLEVWAFGSRAKWNAKAFSDLDLAIITDEPLPLDTSAALSEAFSDSDLPWKVDVLDWASISKEFKDIIEQDKVVVQCYSGPVGDGKHKQNKCETSKMLAPWKNLTLGEFVRLQRGYDLTSEQREVGEFPVMGSAGKNGTHSAYKSAGPGVVIGRSGSSMGSVHFTESNYWPHNTCLYVTDFLGNDPRFVYYFLGAQNLAGYNSGSAQPSLNRNFIYNKTILVPSVAEQQAISHILGTLDDKIELNRKQNETLEAMARALFKAWFVDFEPVRAKMEGRWKRGQSLPGMPAHLYDLFPDRMADSEFGEIPEGWEITSLSEYSSLSLESRKKRSHSGEIRYVDLSNTKWGRIESVTHYNLSDAPSRAQRVLRPLDTIFGTVRPGNGSYAFISEEGLTGSTGFAVLRPLQREYSEFIYLSATAQSNIERLSNLADGGVYPAVHPESVSGTRVPRIGNELINEFSLQVSPMISDIAGNERMSGVLAKLRDALLPGLISGKVRVGGDMKLLGEAL